MIMILCQTIQNATFPIRKALLLDKWSGKGTGQKANDDVKTAGWLELHNGKMLRAVLRGEGGRKASDLPSGECSRRAHSKNGINMCKGVFKIRELSSIDDKL